MFGIGKQKSVIHSDIVDASMKDRWLPIGKINSSCKSEEEFRNAVDEANKWGVLPPDVKPGKLSWRNH